MTPWSERPIEERTLLNPGFCAMLLWHASQGYATDRSLPMDIAVSFLVMPFVLHRETRESLPSNIRTSLPTWLHERPIVRTRLGERAAALRAFTKEALIFGGLHGLLILTQEGVRPNAGMKRRVSAALNETSDEVRQCANRLLKNST